MSDQEPKPKSFAAAELINCEACARANPPTRAACLYCGAALVTGGAPEAQYEFTGSEKPAGSGTYVVLVPNERRPVDDASIAQFAAMLEVKTSEIENAIRAGGVLPLRLCESHARAKSFADEVSGLGCDVATISEQQLNEGCSFKKVRALRWSDDSVTALSVTSGEHFSASWSEVILIVSGRLITTHDEVEKKRGGETNPSTASHVSSDEAVLDVWTNADTALRIFVNSFDFSCLGAAKSLTAFENAKALTDIFRERAANVKIDTTYARTRGVLGHVWPLEREMRASQLRRTGVGKRAFATVTTTTNETQFNQYSRLLHHLRCRELAETHEE